MKLLYDGQEHDVKLAGPSSKVMRLIGRAKEIGDNGAEPAADDEEDVYALLLETLVKSIDGKPPEEADGEIQWAALFAGMKSFGNLAEKKSGRKKGGRR